MLISLCGSVDNETDFNRKKVTQMLTNCWILLLLLCLHEFVSYQIVFPFMNYNIFLDSTVSTWHFACFVIFVKIKSSFSFLIVSLFHKFCFVNLEDCVRICSIPHSFSKKHKTIQKLVMPAYLHQMLVRNINSSVCV